MRHRAEAYFKALQASLCSQFESLDGKAKFKKDAWSHTEGGGGITCILERGAIIEKAGVAFSSVRAALTETMASRLGVQPQPVLAWFGGGTDLTPSYLFEEDVRHYHGRLKNICDRHNPGWYPLFKKECDEYFFIKHRGETRGVGGIFFDYRREDPEQFFLFVQNIGNDFPASYLPIVEQRRHEPWGERERTWQCIRRGRYAEFNLVYDRGTLFGLETGGRTESILMSLPPEAAWVYDHRPDTGSREEALELVLRHPREWA
ncbi:MAG: coproporphyrinogen III oxidase [Ignavibacteria bacterium]|nr:MAG: coproporphyrinogen III oxidase [Ignavibacteria bacterium]